jgi:hypothetical protein
MAVFLFHLTLEVRTGTLSVSHFPEEKKYNLIINFLNTSSYDDRCMQQYRVGPFLYSLISLYIA